MNELIFGRCEDSKKSRAIFQDFYPGKKTSSLYFWNGSTENFETFFDT